MSHRFTEVGVEFTPDRLREISGGAPVTDDELDDIEYALAATEDSEQERERLYKRERRREMLIRLNVALWALVLLFAAILAITGMHDSAALLNPAGP
jgi:hypothetical protein